MLVWAAAPSGPSNDAIASAARSILDSGRPIASNPGAPPGQTAQLLTGLVSYPGSDTEVRNVLTALGPAVPTVTLPPSPTTVPPRFVDTGTDPRFATCREAKANGYGPYSRGEPEYSWYDDRDQDDVVCE